MKRRGRTTPLKITVQGYSGYKLNERPTRFILDDHQYEVEDILDQWYSPDSTYFKVRANDGSDYILRYHSATEEWTLESYRRPVPGE